jgi:hypothetical protein
MSASVNGKVTPAWIGWAYDTAFWNAIREVRPELYKGFNNA